ncbi:DUF3786 domain-containing protein [Anaerospora hongkongensis]|uniref:DUF3786 domain-containing protein n=1 Tax=Anaerospora hongkongensis TaxID=244830 RepID=UPI0028980E4A|nr:DUF3786 domain-containing protein [Anaerospora hongkongensis]
MHASELRPDNLKQAYQSAYTKACEDFQRWNPEDMAASSGTSFACATSTFSIVYAGQGYQVSFPSGEVVYADRNDAVPVTEKIILLHYLIRASGQTIANSWISFKEIPVVGMLYLEPFNKRVTNYLIGVFGNKPHLLLQAGELLGASACRFGNYGIKLNALPRLPIIYALWAGDEEFPPRATVLFDATAPYYLPTEDLVVAAGFCVGKLAQAAKKLPAAEVPDLGTV